jgi:DNA-directed RNA polymerase subunit RPC12/RpoP
MEILSKKMNSIRIFQCGNCNAKFGQALIMLQGKLIDTCPHCGEKNNIKILVTSANPNSKADEPILKKYGFWREPPKQAQQPNQNNVPIRRNFNTPEDFQ